VERGTDYALEQVYAVVDARYLSGKPLIVTTNLAPIDIKNPGGLAYERIYDRILQNSIPVKMAGDSRRAEIAKQKRKKYQSLLGL
jgi:DNA replication protein DnaC